MTGFYQVLGVPFGIVLKFIYETIGFHNYAISIIMLTLLARVIMIPTTINQQKGMAKTQRMQAKIRKIQEETQALYSREGYNPMSAGCGAPMIVQFIVLFGLIGAIYYPLSNFLSVSKTEIELLTAAVKELDLGTMAKNTHLAELMVIDNIDKLQGIEGVSQATYSAISNIDFSFFGLFSLGDIPLNFKSGFHVIWLIPVLSTLSTLSSSLYSLIKQKNTGSGGAAGKSMGCMTIFMAVFTVYFVINYPAGIGIYWIASGLFGLITSIVVGHFYSPGKMLAKIMVDETIERRSRENNIKLASGNNGEEQ